MRNPQGYALWFNGDIGIADIERDTISCGHCNTVSYVKPFQDPTDLGGLCKICMKFICKLCVDTGICDPLEEQIARMEMQDESRRSMGI